VLIRHLAEARVQLLGRSAPPSTSSRDEFAAVFPGYAWAFDSYEVQVVCAALGGSDMTRFGGKGADRTSWVNSA